MNPAKIFQLEIIISKYIFSDPPRRTQYIHAKTKIRVAAATISSAHARPPPPEHLPALRMRERQVVPCTAPRRLRRQRGESYMPMMNLYCDPVTLWFIDACYRLLSQLFMRCVY